MSQEDLTTFLEQDLGFSAQLHQQNQFTHGDAFGMFESFGDGSSDVMKRRNEELLGGVGHALVSDAMA